MLSSVENLKWFLVRHGALLSKLIVVALGVGVFFAVDWVRRRRDRKRALAELALRSLSIDGPRPGPIALRGVLRRTDGKTWIDCGGERVDLAAEVEVVRGSRATWPWRAQRATHIIDDGDEIVTRGVLSRAASDDAGDYRSASGGWLLAPSVDHTTIEVCATQPVARPRSLGPIFTPIAIAALCGISWVGLKQVGRVVNDVHFDSTGPDTETSLPMRLVIGSLLPGSQDRALNRISSWMMSDASRSAEINGRWIEMMEMFDGCRGRVVAEFRVGRFEAAIEDARACGNAADVLPSLLWLARFDEAAAITDGDASLWMRAEATIAAGHWADAAKVAELAQAKWHKNYDCLAALFRVHAGEPGARDALSALTSTNRSCLVAERALATDGYADEYAPELPYVAQRGEQIVRWAQGRSARPYLDTAVEPAGNLERAWLAPFARVNGDSALTHRWVGHYAIALGDFAKAGTELAAITDDPASQVALAYELAMHTGGELPVRATYDYAYLKLERARAIRDGAGDWSESPRPGACNVDIALQPLADGDGGQLARVIEQCEGVSLETVLAAAPRVTRNKAALASAVREMHMSPFDTFSERFAEAAMRRDIARLLGDDATAKRWQDVIDGYARVLADRNRALALLLWQHL